MKPRPRCAAGNHFVSASGGSCKACERDLKERQKSVGNADSLRITAGASSHTATLTRPVIDYSAALSTVRERTQVTSAPELNTLSDAQQVERYGRRAASLSNKVDQHLDSLTQGVSAHSVERKRESRTLLHGIATSSQRRIEDHRTAVKRLSAIFQEAGDSRDVANKYAFKAASAVLADV